MKTVDITGVILTGGRGSRLGGRDKGLVEVADRPLIKHVIERFRPQVNDLFINANRNISRYRTLGYPVISDVIEGFAGPLAGIAVALEHCNSPYMAICPCDSPFLPLDLVAKLASPVMHSETTVSVVIGDGRPQPVFALIPRKLQDSLKDYLASGGRKIMSWYRQQKLVEVDFGPDPLPFANINSAEELAHAALGLSTS
ncbi:MAG TPA: molybdenum cofactor guanylyltransferase MobA [Gammaproteobacteria bacterium]|nr:molybdenum cofactor guanylyltransferase MobA [Gammaproteobacteria bacterium]|tara:strand:+ start:258 stop:854 length:597 start_codon:yes stop_codon:yes gene_type:complete